MEVQARGVFSVATVYTPHREAEDSQTLDMQLPAFLEPDLSSTALLAHIVSVLRWW